MIPLMQDVAAQEKPEQEKPDAYDLEVASVLEELRKVILVSDHTQRDIERHNDWTRGYLNQVLCGHITLTVRHLYGVLGALNIPLTRFFEHMAEKKNAAAPLS
jgi:transcriptional regulator with XRE-family HTH domain